PLLDHRIDYLVIALTYVNRQHSAQRVEISLAVAVPYVRAFAFGQLDWLLVVHGDSGEQVLLVFFDGWGGAHDSQSLIGGSRKKYTSAPAASRAQTSICIR